MHVLQYYVHRDSIDVTENPHFIDRTSSRIFKSGVHGTSIRFLARTLSPCANARGVVIVSQVVRCRIKCQSNRREKLETPTLKVGVCSMPRTAVPSAIQHLKSDSAPYRVY